ncbi:MAG: phosphate/phosphite/phosphonate ABC transporter substrate-binding protein [Gammaproteobacteria bacterium]|nr:phosphate/phosphite/phosphonate ABC transporter substrate-binding protein [Gammaproteobacteria bacterium]
MIIYKLHKVLLFSLLLLPLTIQATEYSFAVVPQYTVSKTFASWQPLMEALEKETGHSFKLKVYKSFKDFEETYLSGKVDFIYYNPYHQVKGQKSQGYIPLVRDGRRKLSGIIVVRKDKHYKQVSDLNNKTVAFPAPNAFAASLYMRALLAEKEQLNITPNYVHSHSNAYRHVVTGKAAAAGGVLRTLKKQPQAIREALMVLYQTPSNSPHPIAVHPRVSKQVRDAVTEAIFLMAESESGQALLTAVQIPSPVKADYKRDYQRLENLGLDKYYHSYD